jgi:hypothetical protein
VQSNPTLPVGMIASSFSGTAIAPWMPATAHATCSEGLPLPPNASDISDGGGSRGNADPGLGYLSETRELTPPPPTACGPGDKSPQTAGCLWNSQIMPLSSIPVTAWLWYQGESDSGTQCGFADCGLYYSRCFPSMIKAWRSAWHGLHPSMPPEAPFLFVQVSGSSIQFESVDSSRQLFAGNAPNKITFEFTKPSSGLKKEGANFVEQEKRVVVSRSSPRGRMATVG